MDPAIEYIISNWPYLFLVLVIIYLGLVCVAIFKFIKGEGNISLGFITFEPDKKLNKLQKQFDALNEHSNFKTQVIKFINQTIITIPEWQNLNKDDFEKDIKSFYDWFLYGISSIITRERQNQLRIAVFYKVDEKLKILHGYGYSPGGLKNLEHSFTNSKAGYCYINKEIYICNDLDTDPTFKRNPKSSKEFNSLLCVPIIYNERILGVLNIDGLLKDSFDKDDIDYITYFCNAFAPLLYQELLVKNIIEEEEVLV